MTTRKQALIILSVLLAIFTLYIFLPFQFSTLDGYGYAVCVQHAERLFAPHHLLYNASNYCIYALLNFAGISVNAMILMKLVNAFFALAALFVLALLLERKNPNSSSTIWWIIFAGLSFGTLRFATDVETYIMPTVFSLLGSYILYKNENNLKLHNIVAASFFAAFACLFHQIHFFWWLALFIYVFRIKKGFKYLMAYIIPAFIVPFAYICVLVFYNHSALSISSFFQFIFHDYLNGQADIVVGFKGILLTVINACRTIFQIHGYLLGLMHVYPILFASVVVSTLILIVLSIKKVFLVRLKKTNEIFPFVHLLLVIMQFLFAALSDGNAEFMAVLVFQIPFVFSFYFINYQHCIKYFALAILVWNISFAAIPMHFADMEGDKKLVDFMHQQPDALYVLKNRPKADNMLRFYYNDIVTVEKAPSTFFPDSIKHALALRIDSFIENNKIVYTDAIENNAVISRESMLLDLDTAFMQQWNLIPVQTFNYTTGKRVIYQFQKK